MLDDDRFDAVVASIYAAAQGERRWGDALDGAVSMLECWSGHLMGFDRQSGAMVFGHEAGSPPPEATLDYILRWHRVDPRNAVLLTAPAETWVHCHEHLSDSFVRSNEFYQNFLIPYGSRYVSGMHFNPSDDLSCILSFQRGAAQEPFDGGQRRTIDRLGKHVRAAFLLQGQARQQLKRSVAGHAVVERLRYPVVLIDQHRTILFENAAATALIDRGDLISRRSGLLTLSDRAASNHLTAAIGSTDGLEPQVRCVRAEGSRTGAALLHVARLLPEETLRAFGSVPVLMLTVFAAVDRARPDPFVLASSFGLTPAEARVAVAAAEGLSDKQIVRRIGTSLATVRTQLQHVYVKTGAARRAELVQLLNSSPGLWLGGLGST